jgi:ABC-type multidrug transport system ATPase subunit
MVEAAEQRVSEADEALSTVGAPGAVEIRSLVRRFGPTTALDDVALSLRAGEIHALLGPNGAGKTTLVRILAGLVLPTSGDVRVAGLDPATDARALRTCVGLVPSGDRSFYLRISGLENLVFFARLHGLTRKRAVRRAREVLEDVGLRDAAKVHVGVYSHGMQKRLSVARALLTDPILLLVDEATHDLDPEGAEAVRELVRQRAARGAAVLWATQKLDEIRGLADNVTVLRQGGVRFQGSVPELLTRSPGRRFVLTLRAEGNSAEPVAARAAGATAGRATISSLASGSDHYLLSLHDGVVLGRALVALTGAGLDVLGCHGERSEVEEAFLALLREDEA